MLPSSTFLPNEKPLLPIPTAALLLLEATTKVDDFLLASASAFLSAGFTRGRSNENLTLVDSGAPHVSIGFLRLEAPNENSDLEFLVLPSSTFLPNGKPPLPIPVNPGASLLVGLPKELVLTVALPALFCQLV